MKKNKYEISLWEDRLVPQTGEGQSIVSEHYEEEKVCIIGSDTMTSQARALEPKLVRNVNGTNKLTFKLYYTYIDNETGKRIQNPFTSLLVNERKVKCKWEDQWYDFVIKGIQEDSNGKTITYTCEDLYINELSKTGFSLEFDQKLNNNQGTAQELAKKVLEGTDWVVDTGSSDHILQTIEEPLYSATLTQNLDAKDKNNATKTILGGSIIYIFYSVVQEKKSYVQFIYNTSYETESNSQLLKENNCYSIDMKTEGWDVFVSTYLNGDPVFSDDYRGKRLVRKQLQEFNSALNRNCYVYKDQSNNKVLGYSTVEYKDPTVVLNLISNSKEFVDTNGWQGALSWELYPLFYGEEKLNYSYTSTTYLRNTAKDPILVFNSGLQDSAGYLEDGLQPGQRYFLRIRGYNGEPKNDTTLTDGISFHIYDYFTALSSENSIPVHNEEDYCEKIGDTQLEDYYFITSDVEKIEGKSYYIRNTETKKYDPKDFPDGAVFPGNEPLYEKGQILQIEFKVIRARPKKEITAGYFGKHTYTDSAGKSHTENSIARPGIFISLPANSWIQEVQFYQRVEGYNGSVIHLGDFDTQSIGTTYYKYFLPNDNYKKEEDIAYLYCGITQKTDLTEVYEDKSEDTTHVLYEKIRSITAKNSNRFNILQNIAETFQCWVRFKIEHNEDTGKIVYEKGIPKKTVYFKEEVGKDLGYGFVYGIDLKTISRSIDSNQLTTKVVVAPNTSEYAENGICRIADADLNENGENYILDFGYYISQGLLNSGELNKYLYLPDNNGKSGFYVELKKKNKEYNEIVEKLTHKKTELSKQTSLQTIYDQYVSNSVTEITTLQNNLCKLVGFDNFDDEKILDYLKTHSDNQEAKNIYSNLITQQHKRESFQASLKLIETSVNELTEVVKGYETKLKTKANEKKVLENAFYQKFSRFIQEGSWTSQDYIDPNLYYLDARSVAYTSSRPKISYNISVIRLNALDEYKGKKFNVGDISFIEDKEFFGYIKGEDAWKTPYHEKVLISESTSWFDSPEKDTFTIQNYKTQFEDLFQRITATTQSLQYSTGEYNRASSIVEGKGVINTETLQNSININNELVFKSQNEEIFQDSTGLTLTDKRDPSKRTKLTSGGLFISTDGGVTWKNAVRGEGVATQYLTSGSINTNNIAIYDGAHASFRWDKYGINAFDAARKDGKLAGVITNTFVRFDQYGIYGIKGAIAGNESYDPQKKDTVGGITAVGEDKIWRDALFGLTWKGFFLKSKGTDNQQIEISTTNDICVTKDKIERIKIGRIDSKKEITEDGEVSHDIYGLRLKDNTGATTMETDDSGQLWLRDKLRISDIKYEKTKDTSFIEGKTYYKKESNGTYSIAKPSEISIKDCYELKNSGVSIGVLETGKDRYQVFNSNNNFIVYNDGTVEATQGNFSGSTIGGFTIEDNRLFSNDVILSSRGIEIKNNGTLSILDGDAEVFSANKTFYEKTTDTIPQEGKTYYTYNKDTGVYTLWEKGESTEFPSDTEIYDAIRKTIFSGTLEGANGSFSGELRGATGIFSGELQGATGVFTGNLTAKNGTIGGFTFNTNNLTSANESVILDGTNGKIIAENIELGNGAEVKDQISFKGADGTVAYLQNPTLHDGVVLSAKDIKLRTSGVLEFGDIKIFGDQTNPTIKSSLWTIDKDKAIFNNVIAQGGTIENVVFKNSTVQGAGGIMFFKPSYSGTSVFSTNTETIFIVEETGLTVGDHVIVNGQEGDITTVEQTKITISGVKFGENETVTIIKLYNNSLVDGKINLTDNLLIGVNSLRAEQSQDGTVGKNEDCHLFRGGLTVTLPSVVTKTIGTGETQTLVEYPTKPNLFIGDLHPITGKPGYGLYGDNVYLNGTLTTKVKSDSSPTYAGVNTIDGYNVDENLFKDKDASQKIVFWAGSIGEDKKSVQQAPFQVTDKGNLYAKAGTFTDSVFSNSKIEGSKIYGADIYTASIHGWSGTSEDGDSSALNIYNTSKGIIFKEEKDYRPTTDTKIDTTKKYYKKNPNETYSIVENPEEAEISSYYEFIEKALYQISKIGFTTPQKEFITILDNTIDFSGDIFRVDTKKGEKEIDRILLSKDGISCFTVLDNEFSSQKSYLSFSKDKVSLKTITSGEKPDIITGELSVEDNKITSNGNFFAQRNILFGNSLEYRKVTEGKTEVGYDLYIRTSTETSVSGQ